MNALHFDEDNQELMAKGDDLSVERLESGNLVVSRKTGRE
jgi:hypothetical protein